MMDRLGVKYYSEDALARNFRNAAAVKKGDVLLFATGSLMHSQAESLKAPFKKITYSKYVCHFRNGSQVLNIDPHKVAFVCKWCKELNIPY